MRKYAARKRRSGTTTVLCWRRRLQRDRLYAAKAVGIVRENRFDAPVEQRAATVRLVDGVGKQAEPRRADLPGDRPRQMPVIAVERGAAEVVQPILPVLGNADRKSTRLNSSH